MEILFVLFVNDDRGHCSVLWRSQMPLYCPVMTTDAFVYSVLLCLRDDLFCGNHKDRCPVV